MLAHRLPGWWCPPPGRRTGPGPDAGPVDRSTVFWFSCMMVDNETGPAAGGEAGGCGSRLPMPAPSSMWTPCSLDASPIKLANINLLSVNNLRSAPKGIGALYLSDSLVQRSVPPLSGGRAGAWHPFPVREPCPMPWAWRRPHPPGGEYARPHTAFGAEPAPAGRSGHFPEVVLNSPRLCCAGSGEF